MRARGSCQPAVGVDFAGTTLEAALFAGVDPTGASFDGAQFTNLTFVGVICPSGKPV